MIEDNLRVVLVVASGNLDREFDLEEEKVNLESTHNKAYLEKPGLYAQKEEGGPTLTFFPSGKFIIRADSKSEVYEESERIFDYYDKDYNKDDIVISNIVGKFKLDRNLKLNPLSINLGLENVEYYEPEQFPALSYKYVKDGVSCTFLAFSTGNIVVTGSNNYNNMQKATDDFIQRIKDNEENFF